MRAVGELLLADLQLERRREPGGEPALLGIELLFARAAAPSA